jgi:hypothetical protein
MNPVPSRNLVSDLGVPPATSGDWLVLVSSGPARSSKRPSRHSAYRLGSSRPYVPSAASAPSPLASYTDARVRYPVGQGARAFTSWASTAGESSVISRHHAAPLWPGSSRWCTRATLGLPGQWSKARKSSRTRCPRLFHKDVPDDYIAAMFVVMANREFGTTSNHSIFPA